MNRKVFALTLVVLAAALAWSLTPVSAGTICPAVTPNPGIVDPSGCNVLITFPASGSPTVSVVDTHPYEFVEDQLVGVVNNSSGIIGSIALTGANIFGFDGDGICAGGFILASLCTSHDSTGYGPNGVTFSVTNPNTGSVLFSPGIAGGSTAFFSLEEAPTAGGGGITIRSPEPASLLLLGGGLFGIFLYRRRRDA